jgi:glucose-6-phosphate isomerase
MNLTKEQAWQRFQQYYLDCPSLGLSLDLSRMTFPEDFFAKKEGKMQKSFRLMKRLEGGTIANGDENRMVGHYWLRTPSLAPDAAIRNAIKDTLTAIKAFTAKVHAGECQGAHGPFKNLLIIGIGGSALGPQFVAAALGNPATDKLRVFFFDNTDPDGMDKVHAALKPELGQTLSLVISKSGGTKETRNGMVEAEAMYRQAGLDFAKHAVAITSLDSLLDKTAVAQGWIARFPMWDWVGGRTSVTSAVGLLPAALQGLDIEALLAGASACDAVTRQKVTRQNPAALLALMWFHAGGGKGKKDLVVLPYKDRLELFSKYLQQLIMESLGKALDLQGKPVNQGLAVYGNKGSTDQHAYIQQLRDGVNNFFVTFIEVLQDRTSASMEVEPGVTSGDFLSGFFLGTRTALAENGRESMTLTIREVSPFTIGLLIALFERAVGLYANLININAYHQPGVEAGKKAAGVVIDLQLKVIAHLRQNPGGHTVAQIATALAAEPEAETLFKICEHLAANADRGVTRTPGTTPFDAQYRLGQ